MGLRSSTSWLTVTTTAPSGRLLGLLRSWKTSRAPSAPRALVASSKKRAVGLRSSTRAMASLCCSPPESSIAQFASSCNFRPSRVESLTASIAECTSSSLNSVAQDG
mmetsp:Transcript_3108/g.5476  ORF Transcript_3108/g.5476 Transcript_3108/m.5476 type:complete len:107 (-) Transcript_3108:1958-2278(-)